MRIKSHTCLCYPERANSTFPLRNIIILEFRQKCRSNRPQGSRYKPDHQSKLSALASAYGRRASTLVVGVIANKFHKVLVYILCAGCLCLEMRGECSPKSKVTRHASEATTSRRIRCVHEDLRAHQSTKTDSRQAHTHIYMTWGSF